MRWRVFLPLVTVLLLGRLAAAEVIPPAPRNHFNDYAGLVPVGTAQAIDAELVQFERDTSNQIVVAIFPHMQSDSSVEDYTVRVAQAWGVGEKDRRNGVVLFVFGQDRQIYVQVGYGLEGALPDAICKQIVADEITPRFRSGDFAGGVQAGVKALMAAARGEYRGNGRTVADRRSGGDNGLSPVMICVLVVVLIGWSVIRRRGSIIYGGMGRTVTYGGNWGGGGGTFGGGGGGFSGGGGSFGGGGAGGKW